MKMIIKGEREEYKVQWRPSGWSYAVPVLRVKRIIPYLPFRVTYWKEVWEGSGRGLIGVEKMLPSDMKEWYRSAIKSYEKYAEEWEKEE